MHVYILNYKHSQTRTNERDTKMDNIFYCFGGQWTKAFSYKSSKESIKQLKKLNKDLNRGPEIDAVNIASDFDRVYFSMNKSLAQMKEEPVL
jgi:hypothetical protein